MIWDPGCEAYSLGRLPFPGLLGDMCSFEDLENLLPDDVSRIVEWFTEKVDALSTKLKPEPKEDEEVRLTGIRYIVRWLHLELLCKAFCDYETRLNTAHELHECACLMIYFVLACRFLSLHGRTRKRIWAMWTSGPLTTTVP